MKKFIHYTLVFLVCISCIPIKQLSSSEDVSHKSVVENKSLNIVYRGVRNHLTIYVPKADSINVSGSGVFKEKENKYYIVPSVGNTLQIKISSFNKGKITVEKREFRILNIGKPFASINNQTIQIKLTGEELANSKINYFIPQLVYELPKVAKFRYKINQEGSYINYGEVFNQSAKEKILKMKPRDSLVIDELSFVNELPNADYKEVNALKIIIQ